MGFSALGASLRAVSDHRTRAWALWPYLLVGFLYLATSPYHRGLNNPNEMVRLYMSAAWVDDGSFDIGPVIRRWGMVDDKAQRDGVLYSSKAPLQSLLGVPAYALSRPLLEAFGVDVKKRTQLVVVRVFGSALFGLAFASLLIAYARRRSRALGAPERFGTAMGLTAALGTMLYPYALTFTGHLIAAFAAAGCYLALLAMSRSRQGSRRWRLMAVLAGFAGGATPFAEYPAALVAAPALVAAFVMVSGHRRRLELLGWLALGGALPFGLGLWAHHELWGSAVRTGYAFLENKGYVELHGEGFFGVSTPKPEALGGTLFSPGTGLFFFSPVLLVGLAMLVLRVFGRWRAPEVAAAPAEGEAIPADIAQDLEIPNLEGPEALNSHLAVAALFGFVFSVYFIASHNGWRGGWTVGPRYIIAVAPLLWIWAVEASAHPRMRPWIAAFGALSVVCTGFASALYPHLSDVYTNPLASFLWPSYLHGETAYGIGTLLGLSGHAANAVHVVPLLGAIIFIAVAGWRQDGLPVERSEGPGRLANPPAPTPATLRRRLGIVGGVFALSLSLIALIPEADADAARRENRRLWGFWEPAGQGEGPLGVRRRARKGRVFNARGRYRKVKVSSHQPGQAPRPCVGKGARCTYGPHPWQRFGPERLDMDGVKEPILFMHPIKGAAVIAEVPVHPKASAAVLRYGLADGSVTSGNDSAVQVTLRQGAEQITELQAGNQFGLHAYEWTLTSTAPITVQIEADNDGARVFGWDLDQYR